MLAFGILLIVYGIWYTFSSIWDRGKDKNKGIEEKVSGGFIVQGIGTITIGIMMIYLS